MTVRGGRGERTGGIMVNEEVKTGEVSVIRKQVERAFDSFPSNVPSSRLALVLDVLDLVMGRQSSLEITDESGRSVRIEGMVNRVVSSTEQIPEMSRSVERPTGRLDSKE